VLDVAAGRVAACVPGGSPPMIAEAVARRFAEVPAALGGGVAFPGACFAGATAAAALITLAQALPHPTPDGAPLRLVVVQVGPPDAGDRLLRLARLARLAARGLADQLVPLTTPQQIQARLALLEALD
jgi:PTS system nitrogen regulatory IIA component